MRTIYKYNFDGRDKIRIISDYPLKFLTCQYQGMDPVIWALIQGDPTIKANYDTPNYEYEAILVGTGWQLPNELDNYIYVGTIQEPKGFLVWHCFVKEVNSEEDAAEIVW